MKLQGSGPIGSSIAKRGERDHLLKQAVVLFAAGAVLGPLLDGLHSKNDVLHYESPMILSAGSFELETCWWVPILFGVAAVILGVSHPLLDRWQRPARDACGDGEGAAVSGLGLRAVPVGGLAPTWTFVCTGIALFALQYALSGHLANVARGAAPVPVDAILCVTAVAHWWAFDRTRGGLFMAGLTSVAGPVVEILLINGAGLYHYSAPDQWGVPTWIPWVYFCGAPAVGNLGRRVASSLQEKLLRTL